MESLYPVTVSYADMFFTQLLMLGVGFVLGVGAAFIGWVLWRILQAARYKDSDPRSRQTG